MPRANGPPRRSGGLCRAGKHRLDREGTTEWLTRHHQQSVGRPASSSSAPGSPESPARSGSPMSPGHTSRSSTGRDTTSSSRSCTRLRPPSSRRMTSGSTCPDCSRDTPTSTPGPPRLSRPTRRALVTLADAGTVEGDVLVIGVGAQPNYFHTTGAEEFAIPLYSMVDAERIRSRLLQLFRDTAAKPELVDEGALTFVIVGAGPTGVETAGAIAELAHDVMPHVYPDLRHHRREGDPRRPRPRACCRRSPTKAHTYAVQAAAAARASSYTSASRSRRWPTEQESSRRRHDHQESSLVIWGGGEIGRRRWLSRSGFRRAGAGASMCGPT